MDHVNDVFGQVATGYITFSRGLILLQVSPNTSLSIIKGKNQMYKTLIHEFRLSGESHFDIHPLPESSAIVCLLLGLGNTFRLLRRTIYMLKAFS
jgi:hypothetical protein